MSNLPDKQEAFLTALNDKLPRGVRAQYRPSKDMPNVLNVLIGSGNMLIQKFGLIEDPDGSIWWFNNFTGGLY